MIPYLAHTPAGDALACDAPLLQQRVCEAEEDDEEEEEEDDDDEEEDENEDEEEGEEHELLNE